ncbi:MerR family transcriptional regulator [Streptomyces radicis]|uniref:MerR family transcriptional regulator n=1 Tax=Streptomyces radicis TaxID=1750517 RepID=A0A3A9WPL3_9ACTN|nr:MerR family transcriptional regulator [Streptomyces radicis]RKN11444.1 MerR family transcriptional regulator [Streptomyces radicis]RKN26536.1 MerR family transcriptional regulator [Streptomyces radicis]
MRIGDAAAAAGLTTRAVRYYEECGLLSADRLPSGHRRYDAGHVQRLRAIRDLLAVGLTVQDVATLVHSLDRLPPEARGDLARATDAQRETCGLPASVIRRRLDDLDDRIERLTTLRDALAERVGEPLRRLTAGYADAG